MQTATEGSILCEKLATVEHKGAGKPPPTYGDRPIHWVYLVRRLAS